MKKILFLGAIVATTMAAPAVIYTTNWNSGFVNGTSIPDGSYSGWTDTRTVNTMPAGTLVGVAVDLQLTSGWAGDLYAYLINDTGFAVLLDRVGGGSYGAATLNVTLADDGFNGGGDFANIHTYGGGSVSGTWNPDNSGITSSPGSLGSFLAGSPNGTWTLFIADLSGGGVTTIANWGLQMDIVAVPEVESWVAAALAGAFAAFWVNRQIWDSVRRDA